MTMSSSFTSRGVMTVESHEVEYDDHGKPFVSPWLFVKFLTRAKATIPRYDLVTDIMGLDGEFQFVIIVGVAKQRKRIGRISLANKRKQLVYDAFADWGKKEGETITLPPRSKKLGVYWEDIKPENGAVPIEEVEYHVQKICKGRTIVGHSIHNDIDVFHKGVFQGCEVRDTQLHEPYRAYATGTQRLPKLKVLVKEFLGQDIQGEEHTSVEDAVATLDLYLRDQEAIDESQKGWKVEEGSIWGELGIVDGSYAPLQEEDAVGEPFEQIVDTDRLRKLPLSEAGTFWQRGSEALKTNNNRNTLSAKANKTTPKQSPAFLPSTPSSDKMTRSSSIATTTSSSGNSEASLSTASSVATSNPSVSTGPNSNYAPTLTKSSALKNPHTYAAMAKAAIAPFSPKASALSGINTSQKRTNAAAVPFSMHTPITTQKRLTDTARQTPSPLKQAAAAIQTTDTPSARLWSKLHVKHEAEKEGKAPSTQAHHVKTFKLGRKVDQARERGQG